MPGWTAVVNGRAVPVQRSEAIFQEIPVQAGHNRVVFTFAPPHIGIAWALCLVGVVVAVSAWVLSRRGRA
jgi:uncharacterized membrane protein YfhO